MNDEQRAALVTELADSMGAYRKTIDRRVMPIIDRLLAERTPVDGDAVERAAKAMFEFDRTCMKASVEWDDLPGTLARNGVSGRQHYREMARAALAAAQPADIEDRTCEIVVNGQITKVSGDVVGYHDLVALAFPGLIGPESTPFTITFREARNPKEGTLTKGQTVVVAERGAIFNVVHIT